jgi:hypothetical protein
MVSARCGIPPHDVLELAGRVHDLDRGWVGRGGHGVYYLGLSAPVWSVSVQSRVASGLAWAGGASYARRRRQMGPLFISSTFRCIDCTLSPSLSPYSMGSLSHLRLRVIARVRRYAKKGTKRARKTSPTFAFPFTSIHSLHLHRPTYFDISK